MRFLMLSLTLAAVTTACTDGSKGEDGDATDATEATAAPNADNDADGHPASSDCDDNNTAVHPGAEEVPYDGLDNDCDPSTPDDDLDGDGFGITEDCDDEDASLNPGASERCDGLDNDCDGTVDNNTGPTWYHDGDDDGFGDPNDTIEHCDGDTEYVANNDDCNDDQSTVNPAADELCNGQDDDCDGFTDEEDAADATPWYADGDGDGYGSMSSPVLACEAPSGHVSASGDCDDAVDTSYPGADEYCDDADNDCDGFIDEEDAIDGETFFLDTDRDGYGDPDAAVTACEAPSGAVADNTDCDDRSAGIHPGAEETWYDGVDQNCDALNDYDADGDGDLPEIWGGGDCNDGDATIYLGATDTWYDGVDSNCDGASDYDADSDGYDSDAYSGEDCDDTDNTVYPMALETDGTIDNNCDGEIEEMPLAVAAYDASASLEVCLPLTLDGSGSSDPDGTPLAYTWQLTSAPTASLLTSGDIEHYTDEAPSFWPDEPGDYQFSLSVTDDGDEVSFPDTVTATVVARTSSNTAPVADAGADETTNATIDCYPLSYGEVFECTTCQPINLSVDATASSDPDGEQLIYEWAVLSGDVVILSQSDGAASIVIDSTTQAEYGATVTDTYELEVTVTDCTGDTDTDTVVISYECTGA